MMQRKFKGYLFSDQVTGGLVSAQHTEASRTSLLPRGIFVTNDSSIPRELRPQCRYLPQRGWCLFPNAPDPGYLPDFLADQVAIEPFQNTISCVKEPCRAL